MPRSLSDFPPQFKPSPEALRAIELSTAHRRLFKQLTDQPYPLGDYLYNRSKAQDDMIRAQYRWRKMIDGLSEADRQQVEKIARIFRKNRS